MSTSTEYQQQVAQLQRRRAIADALMQNVMSSQPVSPGARITPLQVIAGLGSGLLGMRMNGDVDKRYADIASEMSANRNAALEDLANSAPDAQVGSEALNRLRSTPDNQLMTPVVSRTRALQRASDAGVDPNVIAAVTKKDEGFNLGPGQVRFDSAGRQIAAVPEKAPEDYVDYVDLGDKRTPVSHRTGKQVGGLPDLTKGMTPAGAAAEKNRHPGVTLSDSAIDLAAKRLLNGEEASKVLANFGRGTQGAANITAVQNRFAELAASPEYQMGAEDIATKIQELGAEKRARTELGAREGKIAPRVQEAINFANIAKQASAEVPRGSFVPWNKLKQYGDKQISDPALAKFKAANVSLINAYAAAVGGGVPTVHDKQVADDLLSTADSPEAYNAVVDQLITESQNALQAPRQVMEDMNLNGPKKTQTPASFASEAEAQAAAKAGKLKPGTKIVINGVSGTWQ